MNTQKTDVLLQRIAQLEKELAIESALERVRKVAMAMKKAGDLLTACEVVHKELSHAGFNELRNTMINIYNDAEKVLLNYDYSVDCGASLNRVPYSSHPIVSNYIEEAKQADDTVTRLVIEGAALEDWKLFREKQGEKTGPKLRTATALYYYHYSFETGVMGISAFKPVTTEQLNIFKRFRNVFNLSYQRYIDISRAEAQAREAQIETALERVRTRTVSMQKSEELANVAELLFTQVNDLGIQTWTTGFNVWSDNNNSWTDYVTNPNGGFIEPYTIDATQYPLNEVSEAKKRGDEFFVRYEEGEKLAETYRQLSKFGEKQYKAILDIGFQYPTKQYEHFVFGSKVSLMFITYEPVPAAHDVFIRFGKVFEQTYTRFLDLQKAEAQALRAEQDVAEIKAARKKAEDTLLALQATQQQLVQKEKMASLGELTAGIAHEIQNPLNFVNNFAAINQELLTELKLEMAKKNYAEAGIIVNNLEENESKIAHHGKRADSIVKGMLQHSRKSEGVKEPTNINVLVDEYFKLSFHGYRAKDKAFHAGMETHYDEAVGTVAVVAQDISRVLLNLFNNAFYAVNEKRKHLNSIYEPVVSVSTERKGDQVVITVKDNGTGIPQKTLAKIYHPFFTTKPAGEGTGLGLSLSYDIVTKGHGGNLYVQSIEGEGAEFVVELPAS